MLQTTQKAIRIALTFVLALHTASICLANTLYRADQQRTGRSPYVTTAKHTEIWTYKAGAQVSSSPIVGADASINFAAYDQKAYSISNQGALRWKTGIGDVATASAAVGQGGITYYATTGGKIVALSQDGQKLWAGPCHIGALSGSPLVDQSGFIYAGSQDNHVYAIDPEGKIIWSYLTGGTLTYALAMSPDGSVIYAPSADGSIYAVNTDGSARWKSANITPSGNCAVADNGTIYAGSADGYLYALNPNGSLLWKFMTMGKITAAPAIALDGTIYFGSQDSNLYAVNPNGTLKWTHRSYTSIYSAPTIDAAGLILYGSWDGKVTALDKTSGAVKWSEAVGTRIYTSPTIGPDGNVYVIDASGTLIALGDINNMPTPEPSSLLALAGALGALACWKRNRNP